MTSQYDNLFSEQSSETDEYTRRRQAEDAMVAERKAVWQQVGGELAVALQPIADSANAHGHQATIVRDERGRVVFEVRLKDHPDEPVRCTFFCSYPPNSDALLYIDFDGPGRWDDALDPVRQKLSSFTVESGCGHVTELIRRASKLLP